MSFPLFQIAGNIKQQFLPFVINPKNPLHHVVNTSPELNSKGAAPQLFTYKNASKDVTGGGVARLNFYPSSLNSIHVNDDISFKLLYGTMPDRTVGPKSLTLKDVLNNIPGVQIREYLPDTRLDQCINMFTDIFKNMAKLIKGSDKKDPKAKQENNEDSPAWYKKLWEVASYTIKYMVGMTNPSFFTDISALDDVPFSSYKADVYKNAPVFGKMDKSPGYYVMTFPYTLYYRLQSCVTTNIYEVPGSDSNKLILQSAGTKGWTDGGSDFMSAGGFRVSGLLSKIPVIGNLANMLLGNIGINYMPWWNAESGAKTQDAEIEITFDLFNDSFKSAMSNFIFVNTIVPNNRWVQYNMFQHSPCIYDVKLEGINRLFACAANFDVKYEGVLRNPSKAWIEELCSTHLNDNIDKNAFKKNAMAYNLIKIPDVYKVSLKFTSLLPATFNTFLFNYSENASHITKYGPGSKVYQQSAVSKMISDAMTSYIIRVGEVWNKGDENAASSKEANKAVAAAKKEQDERMKQEEQKQQQNDAQQNNQNDLQDVFDDEAGMGGENEPDPNIYEDD